MLYKYVNINRELRTNLKRENWEKLGKEKKSKSNQFRMGNTERGKKCEGKGGERERERDREREREREREILRKGEM